MKFLTILAVVMLSLCGCQSKRAVTLPEHPEGDGIHLPRPQIVEKSAAAMPKAVAYKTSGNYNNQVFIRIDADGNVLSYPAPSDVNENSAPIVLSNGWLLDRRGGIGTDAAFLSWTWAEYHDLSATPSVAALKAHIIDGAKVSQVLQLPYTVGEAEADTAAVVEWISKNAPSAVFRKN